MGLEEFTLERFERENWTEVDPIPNSQQRGREAEQWCRDTLSWKEWVRFGPSWYFKNEADAIMFRLKWS